MDKFIKGLGLDSGSSTSSYNEYLLDKVKVEIPRSSEEFKNTRRLTVESTVKPDVQSEESDIDKQIRDLENLIRKLQDEIIEMSNKVDIPDAEEYKPTEQTKNTSLDHNTVNHKDNTNHIYPIILRDAGIIFSGQSNKLTDQMSKLVNYSGSYEDTGPTYTEIRRNFNILWGDDYDENFNLYAEKGERKELNMDKLISELTTEIKEELNNTDEGPVHNNSDKEI